MADISAGDLFCGGGGTSTGLVQACAKLGRSLDLIAINHWDVAIETHALNHPWARHLCASLDGIEPLKQVPAGYLNLLVASPECIHFSNARGDKPMSDQSRSSAWLILKWLQTLYVENVLIENVREFMNWGPIGKRGRPLQARKGDTFRAFIHAMRSLGYRVEWRVLNAADYGDATSRERLFIIARRGNRKIVWPEPTHAKIGTCDSLQPWKPAKQIIDWELQGRSIFDRKRPLAESTIRRIAAGLQRYEWPEPFLVVLRNHMDARSINEPLPALAASGNHMGICEPFILGQHTGSVARSISEPIPTIAAKGAISLIQPFLVKFFGTAKTANITEPLDTITAKDRFGLVTPQPQIDILFRMLQPHELAKAMSFPDQYRFTGTRESQVRQIGNAVPVSIAEALCTSLLNN